MLALVILAPAGAVFFVRETFYQKSALPGFAEKGKIPPALLFMKSISFLANSIRETDERVYTSMSAIKDKQVQESRVEEIQQQLGDCEDHLHSEYVREWILQLAAEREAKTPRSVKATKSTKRKP
jgi:hypothetical protein